MRQVRWASWTVAATVVLLVGAPQVGRADVTSDKAAAIVVWPIVNVGGPAASDTLIQLSNTGTKQVEAACFYVNANSHCTNSGAVCTRGADCCAAGSCGQCIAGWQETDFRIHLTAGQPIGWEASDGLLDFCAPNEISGEPCIPIDGSTRFGPKVNPLVQNSPLQSNAGTRIPPVPEVPFIGELKCIAVDPDTGVPLSALNTGPVPPNNVLDPNTLKGEATLESVSADRLDVGKYNAIGIRALDNPNTDGQDNVLTLLNGHDPQTNDPLVGEYEGCPGVIILNHFFDFAVNPVTELAEFPLLERRVFTWPVFVPCTENFLQQTAGTAVAQYLVYNEFEQRFSTSNTIKCFGATGLSNIDTPDPSRSVFSVGVAGTLTGQTRITPQGSGLLAVALEYHSATAGTVAPVLAGATALATGRSGDFNVHYQGQRATADLITMP